MNRNYTYGCKPPITNADLVNSAIHKGFLYRNKLVELHNKHPNPLRAWNWEYKKECDLAYGRVAKENKPKFRATPEEMLERKERIRVLMAVERAAIRGRMPKPDEPPEILAERHAALGVDTRAARATCGVSWGTYLLAERAAEKAQKFARWDGEGAMGVQIHGRMDASDLGDHTFVQIVPMPEQPGARFPLTARWSLLRIRVGTVPGKITPIWAEFPIRMHRPIPPGVQIEEVKVRREMRGNAKHWTATFSLNGPEEAFQAPAQGLGVCDVYPPKADVVGVDLGWRRIAPGFVRVAYWHGSDGAEEDVRMPSATLDMLERYESGRDQNFNAHRDALVAWLTGIGVEGVELWKSKNRFAHALLDRDPPDELCAWRKQDRHLANAIAGMEKQIYDRREARYCEVAAMLAKRYAQVRAEDCNLSDLRRERPGEGEDATASRRLAALVAPGKFRMKLKDAAERHGSEYALVPAPDTTRTCSDCGHVNNWPDQAPLMLTCAGCGRTWDQDQNAARIIASASVTPVVQPKKVEGLSKRQQRFRKNRSKPVVEVVEETVETA